MRIGVTGSRRNITLPQIDKTFKILRHYYEDGIEFHHGACVDFDERAAALAWSIGYNTIAHPPKNEIYLSKISLALSHEVHEPKDYLERNKDVVDNSDFILAAPNTIKELAPRSGTWYTIGYAMKRNIEVHIIWPDGVITDMGEVNVYMEKK